MWRRLKKHSLIIKVRDYYKNMEFVPKLFSLLLSNITINYTLHSTKHTSTIATAIIIIFITYIYFHCWKWTHISIHQRSYFVFDREAEASLILLLISDVGKTSIAITGGVRFFLGSAAAAAAERSNSSCISALAAILRLQASLGLNAPRDTTAFKDLEPLALDTPDANPRAKKKVVSIISTENYAIKVLKVLKKRLLQAYRQQSCRQSGLKQILKYRQHSLQTTRVEKIERATSQTCQQRSLQQKT